MIIDTLSVDADLTELSKCTKWEILKLRIKEQSIKDSVRLAQIRNCEISHVETEIQNIDSNKLLCNNLQERKDRLQSRLDELYSEKVQGAIIRSKIQQVNEVEHNANYFKGVEINRQRKQVIDCLLDDKGNEIYDQNKILEMICNFYKDLYTSKHVNQIDIDALLDNVQIENFLSEEDKLFLDKMPSIEEFDSIVLLPKENKSPGLDGLPKEFYRKFWHKLRNVYYDVILESYEDKQLPLSTRTSVLSTLFKSDNNKCLKNYRPLSLTNCDYRIVALLFATRLEKVLHKIINNDQSAYIKGRYIGTSIRNVIDLFDYCESTDQPGAMICADFLKAFDSLEHNFIFSVLRRLNFGENFISWLSLMYNDARFKVKNNGWVSQSHVITRGLRQGCSMSALIFIIAVEILGMMIRQNNNIEGIMVGNKQHKLIQFADDTTICVRNLESINEIVRTINDFGKCSGLNLNFSKTKGIWLGNLKNYGFRTYGNILFTGKPVKCLGVYIGHNTVKCNELNWTKRLDKLEKSIQQWNKRRLTLLGKVKVIKTYLLSKIVYVASVLCVPQSAVTRLKDMLFGYLWGKRDKVKRKTVIRKLDEGGLNMVDVDSFIGSLKASWTNRLQNVQGKWLDVLSFYIDKLGLSIDYVLKTNIRRITDFPVIHSIPEFYRDIIFNLNKCKSQKDFNALNKHEILSQPIWGNNYFKVGNRCLYFKEWIKCGILYVKDLIDDDGLMLTDDNMFRKICDKKNIVNQVFIIKNYVMKRIKSFDTSIGPYVKIKPLTHIVNKNKFVELSKCRSRDFYEMLVLKCKTNGNMESIYSRDFNTHGSKLWKDIYSQKVKLISIPKIAEFNFKLLHNIVPCGYVLNKWNTKIDMNCQVCNSLETTKHMIYDCHRVRQIWNMISDLLKVNISWKKIVCGFPGYELSNKITILNYVISVICYTIFKSNSRSKFEETSYQNMSLQAEIKKSIMYYNHSMCSKSISESTFFRNIMYYFQEEF